MVHKSNKKKAKGKAKDNGEPKEKVKEPKWQEALKDYPVLKLDLRPEYFAASYKKLLEDIVMLLEKEVENELKRLPKKDRIPSKVNGKQYTPDEGSGGFLVYVLPASGDPNEEVILLYGLADLYLNGFHDGEVWFILNKATIPIPPATQVPYGRPSGLKEGEESPFDDGIFIFMWSGSYVMLKGGQNQLFYSEAFRDNYTKLKGARQLLLEKKFYSLQRPVAFFAVGISEATRFEEIGDWVLIQSTDLSLVKDNGKILPKKLRLLTNRWGTESDSSYGPNTLKGLRVVKRNPLLHLDLKPKIFLPKNWSKKAQTEEVEDDSEEEDEEEKKPLVSVKETIQAEVVGFMESLDGPLEFVERTAPDGRFSLKVSVCRIPDALTAMLEDREESLSKIMCSDASQAVGCSARYLKEQMISAIDSGLQSISGTLDDSRGEQYRNSWLGNFKRIWALGPCQAPSNLLLFPDVNASAGQTTSQDGREGIRVCFPCHISHKLGFVTMSEPETENDIDKVALTCAPYSEALSNSIILGFHLATCKGPICDEPMWGLAFTMEVYIFAENPDNILFQDETFSWQVTATVEEACIAAVRRRKPLIVEPIYLCELTLPSHRLDAARGVIQDCRGKVLTEEMPVGDPLFTVRAHLPAAESCKFSDNLRIKTSAAAHAELAFSHWEAIPESPLFIPNMHEGIDKSEDGPNLARTIMHSVRERKGLPVEELGEEQQSRTKRKMEYQEDIGKDMAMNEEAVVFEPLVSFKETVLKDHLEFVDRTTPDGKFAVRIGVYRLPDDLTNFLDGSANMLAETISQSSQDVASDATELREKMIRAMDSGVKAISGRVGEERCKKYRKTLARHLKRIWALGHSDAPGNMLILPEVKSSDSVITTQGGRKGILLHSRCHVSERLGFMNAQADSRIDASALAIHVSEPEALKKSIIAGFHIAASAGPLCEEPMWGMAFTIQPYTFVDNSTTVRCSNPYEQRMFDWQVSKAVKEACLAAVLQSRPRLVQPVYLCEVTTPTDELGAVHAVLGEYRAKVLKEEEMHEGTALFTVHANLPVAGSSRFTEMLRNRTSGAAIVRLAEGHWEAITEDPLIEKSGDGTNVARTLLHSVRRRKGLPVEDEALEDGTTLLNGAKNL